jgi:hypothetical protein
MVFHSLKTAARELKIDRRYIENFVYLNQLEPVLGRYVFKFDKTKMNFKVNSNQPKAQQLYVLDNVTGIETIYPSITIAGKSLGLRQAAISLYIKDKRTKPYKKRYVFKLVNSTISLVKYLKPELRLVTIQANAIDLNNLIVIAFKNKDSRLVQHSTFPTCTTLHLPDL